MNERLGVSDRNRLELPRRHRGGGDALSGRQCRSDHARHSALGHRLSGAAAGRRCCCGAKWPQRARSGPRSPRSGLCFFGLFFVLYNIAIGYTTAARASLALSTLPLQTMVVGALLGIEPLTLRKSLGVGIAFRRRARRARLRHRGRAAGRLARRIDHDRRGAVHGVLQCVVAALHAALERAGISHRRHGGGRLGARSRSAC